MDEAIDLHDIKERTGSAYDETDHITPTASKVEKKEYEKISTLAETTIGRITDKDTPAGNVDKVPQPKIDTAELKKVYIFCTISLIMSIISIITIVADWYIKLYLGKLVILYCQNCYRISRYLEKKKLKIWDFFFERVKKKISFIFQTLLNFIFKIIFK